MSYTDCVFKLSSEIKTGVQCVERPSGVRDPVFTNDPVQIYSKPNWSKLNQIFDHLVRHIRQMLYFLFETFAIWNN